MVGAPELGGAGHLGSFEALAILPRSTEGCCAPCEGFSKDQASSLSLRWHS
jgi:hypothetical protein